MKRFGFTLAAIALLTACGGENGSTPPPPAAPLPPPPPVGNRPPAFTSANTASVRENTSEAFYTAAATDPDGNSLSYSISGGVDAAGFQISSTGVLQFRSPPDFEGPEDADRNNVYEVQLAVSDGAATTNMALAVTVLNEGPDRIAVKRSNHTFGAVALTPVPDGSGRMFGANYWGGVFILDPVSGSSQTFFNLGFFTHHHHWTSGLRGFALAPDFMTSGTFYLTVTTGTGDLELRRYRTEPDNRFVGNSNSGDVLLRIPYGGVADYLARGGWIGFGPDGNLYMATGDGSAMDTVSVEAQDTNSLRGKILRIGVGGDDFPSDPLRDYTIPAGNPFIGSGRPEVWLIGLRDPRPTFDAPTQTLWIGDTGRNRQEINLTQITEGGTNFGWPLMDGTTVLNGPSKGLLPVLEWPTGGGPREAHFAVSGHIYRGAIERLRGRYIFGATGGKIWSVALRDVKIGSTISSDRFTDMTEELSAVAGSGILSFGLDDQGDLYVGGNGSGRVFWLEPEAL